MTVGMQNINLYVAMSDRNLATDPEAETKSGQKKIYTLQAGTLYMVKEMSVHYIVIFLSTSIWKSRAKTINQNLKNKCFFNIPEINKTS